MLLSYVNGYDTSILGRTKMTKMFIKDAYGKHYLKASECFKKRALDQALREPAREN